MTVTQITGASSTKGKYLWPELPWHKIKAHVLRLQMRIAKAEREGRKGRVKALQRLLTSSFYAKCTAVKRVTSNAGRKTPGVDGELWKTDKQKMQAVSKLKRRGYTAQPLRRIHIPKKSGKLRPLSIPVMICRAMQALYMLALQPIAEERADPNAYGFRPKRSAHDAIAQCFVALCSRHSATWVLEGDIKSCFDRMCHNWLEENIPMDKIILKKFLKAGFMENGQLNPTTLGTPQGGIISPTLTVMALSGLEKKLRSSNRHQQYREKINVIAYADDFVVTASSKELLYEKVIPVLADALGEVGLELSKEKTKITPIREGFNFLGFNIRKYRDGKLLTKPSKANVIVFLRDIRSFIKQGTAMPTEQIIHRLNQKITGWTNYFRTGASSKTFSMIDCEIFQSLKRWCIKRHQRKGIRWIMRKYFSRAGNNCWRFHCPVKDKEGVKKILYLKRAAATPIRRHLKIKGEANPFDPSFKEYFKKRAEKRKTSVYVTRSAKSAGLRIVQPYAGLSGVQ